MFAFINHCSLRHKLIGLTLLPLIGFIYFAGDDFAHTYKQKSALEEMLVLTESAKVSSLLVHELQKERGASAGFLSSKGKKFANAVPKHRQTTDKAERELQQFINRATLTPQLQQLFNKIQAQLKLVPEMRRRVDSFSVSISEEVAFYTQLNALLLSIIDNTANQNRDIKLALSAVSIGSFLQHKERAGIERAVLSNVFAKDQFTPALLEKFIRLVAEQQAYINKFKAHANEQQLSIYNNNLSADSVNAVQSYRDLALSKMAKGGFNTDPTQWFDTITKKINQLKSIEVELLDALYEQNQTLLQKSKQRLFSLALGILIPLALVILLSFYITTQLHKGIKEVTEKLCAITENNDLSIRLAETGDNELARIAMAVNQLVSHLQDLVSNIQSTSQALKYSAAENIQHNQAIESNISNGSEQLSQIVTATTEMSSTVAEIANNAVQASGETEKANIETEHGNQEVAETIENINHLAEELNSASKVIEVLNDSALNIGKFLSVIREISEKTNLLALNAAIEAARAGESGRGFAVVADEVRSLALQTKDATNEIETMINELQASSLSAQNAMNNGTDLVEKSVCDATKTGKDIAHITSCINEINKMNEQIATAAEEQSCVTEEINRNMVAIQDGYGEMKASYESINESSKQVDSLANELNDRVSSFKI